MRRPGVGADLVGVQMLHRRSRILQEDRLGPGQEVVGDGGLDVPDPLPRGMGAPAPEITDVTAPKAVPEGQVLRVEAHVPLGNHRLLGQQGPVDAVG